ncbi:precorrin-2 dehydrogenase/sirohydrochlorin ferrochelatase family protein [Paraclostridium sordellii]|uniref:precorrin-2 dehydrogenase/sirohydrochlorin ferrochelatase family protein n=1 Tax=Paraclostridium sordellii TaxID=1505 RepID=UPI0005E2E144|nr:bifunctional precorrin-2 dehydrogenase/sirohydrochlorin ferrochelatase [Paeniclostridium sordellii]MCQ4699115.1 bifunctional precorrin-2 dehydrogenase/sirohydrochlorin ferrochelatase [Paeniclostridium sordellii]QYE97787.1 bifunctional precorrin-2 dehydrogenase/sirohydrochlorin ferrochelatase [Paeniclostridium sordellii]CEN79377.1 precorrin-2 dehydrogenase [[Clostridium] sordellii] [Paeniclostridium sordellii]CEO10850.1 precorrin-2 dehydrogenase [[Clostridium] sordellii] [Paeniclostridium sor
MNYPIMIDLMGKEITVIGGGKIAYRKVNNFLKFGYEVTVVSREFIEDFKKIENKIKIIKDEYSEIYIKDSFIVVAATNNKKVNESIGMFCRTNNKLVNVIDDPKLSNFIVPSCVKRGDLVISISTGGKSPSLASKIRKDLEIQYDDSYEEYLILLGELREQILEKYNNPSIRKDLLNKIINLNYDELKKLEI